jgi:hypothetical protein
MPRRIYQMKAMIVITKPQVWRRLLVPKTASLFASPAAAGGVRLVELPNAARRTIGK